MIKTSQAARDLLAARSLAQYRHTPGVEEVEDDILGIKRTLPTQRERERER